MNTISLKIFASLVALFGLGAGSGYVVAKRTSPPPVAPLAQVTVSTPSLHTNLPNRFFVRWSDGRISEYRELLNLTPAQETAIREHLATLAGDYDALRGEVRAKLTASIARANKEIARDLTPEQRRLFWQHLREKANKAGD